MKLKRITSPKSEGFRECWEIYKQSFSKINQRTLQQQKDILEREEYHLCSIEEDEKIIGLIAYWDFRDFIYGEHLSVKNKGASNKVIREILKRYKKPKLLDIDLPMDKALVSLYKEEGFRLNSTVVSLPPYKKEDTPSRVLLMSHPEALPEDQLKKAISLIKERIYRHDR